MSFKQTLTNLFGHNAVKKALIWVLVVAVAVIVVVTQFAFPVKAQYAYTRLYSYSGQSFDNMIKNVYDKLKDGTHLDSRSTSKLLSDTDFDMTKSENYLRVEMVFDITNIGMYKISNIQFSIDDIPYDKQAFVLKETNISSIDRFNSSKVSLIFVIDRSGLTNEEITKAVSSLKISYKFDRPELFSSGGEITLPETVLLPFDEAKTGG